MLEMMGKWDRAKYRRSAMFDLLKTTREENAQTERKPRHMKRLHQQKHQVTTNRRA
jgi:hypothetical protein